MQTRNFVAKHCRTFNKATVQRDRTKYHRPSIVIAEEDWDCEDWEDWGYPDTEPEEQKTPSINAIVYKRSFTNTGDNYAFHAMRTRKGT